MMELKEIDQKIKEIFDQTIKKGIISGVSYAVVDEEQTLSHYLGTSYQDGPQLAPGMLYDLASLTKVVGTASGIFGLLDQGKIRLEDQVGDFFATGFDQITIKELLLHTSGLAPDLDNVWQYDSPQAVWEAVKASRQVYQPGTDSVYSDLNFIVLGKILEIVTGEPLDRYLKEKIFLPVGMQNTGFLPKAEKSRIVPTEITKERGWVWGSVHDETAYQMGGVAGHAGLFSSLDDLVLFSKFYLEKSKTSPVIQSLVDYDVFERTLAWIRWQAGKKFYWHTGFTGPGLGIDLDNKRAIIILANAVYPKRGNTAWQEARRQATASFFGVQYRIG
ncbi:serine hydrolase domain-containing protein [Lactobacillus sp.]|uniref:serine hydrolase domain-containing protein n=1 Tax=Lactobacillus sp. TaxID=1591 RepID=UPI003EFA42EB